MGYDKSQMSFTNMITNKHKKLVVLSNNAIIDLYDTSITEYKWTFKLLSLPLKNPNNKRLWFWALIGIQSSHLRPRKGRKEFWTYIRQ